VLYSSATAAKSQRDVNANSAAIWQSLGTCQGDCMEFHGCAICYLVTITND